MKKLITILILFIATASISQSFQKLQLTGLKNVKIFGSDSIGTLVDNGKILKRIDSLVPYKGAVKDLILVDKTIKLKYGAYGYSYLNGSSLSLEGKNSGYDYSTSLFSEGIYVKKVGSVEQTNIGANYISFGGPSSHSNVKKGLSFNIDGISFMRKNGLGRRQHIRIQPTSNINNSAKDGTYSYLYLPYKNGTLATTRDIPVYKAGNNIVIDNSSPLSPIISANVSGITDNIYTKKQSDERYMPLWDKDYNDLINKPTPSSGLEKIKEAGKTGYRLKGANPEMYGDIGNYAIDMSMNTSSSPSSTLGATGDIAMAWGSATTASGVGSTAWGSTSQAKGDYSTSWGYTTQAQGEGATSWGQETNASGEYATVWGSSNSATGKNATVFGGGNEGTGNYSTVFGIRNSATGNSSTSWGEESDATGDYSTAFGFFSKAKNTYSLACGYATSAEAVSSTAIGNQVSAKSYGEVVVGINSTDYTAESLTEYNENDRIFTVGNGASSVATSDALVIYKNGYFDINGLLKLKPMTLPTSPSAGMLLFDSADNKLKYYNGTTWIIL